MRSVTSLEFEGRPIPIEPGDTIAAALYRAGVRVFSRSFKYHRPRGLYCGTGDCPNCSMTVDGEPAVRTCITPAAAGQRVRRSTGWPSAEWDFLGAPWWLRRLLPVGTVMFKSLISMKSRNVIIFAFHPRAQKCRAEAAKIMLEAAVSAGAPADSIQWIEEPSIEATNLLFKHPGVNLILATGGNAMVKSAYSSGHPAIGVGAGNTPVFVSKSAKLSVAVNNVIASKTFDNGTICSSDQSMIFDDKATCDAAVKMMVERGAYLVNEEEKKKLEAVMFDKERGVPAMAIVGKSPQVIAKLAGFEVPEDTKLLLVPLTTIGPEDWFSHEKLSPSGQQ